MSELCAFHILLEFNARAVRAATAIVVSLIGLPLCALRANAQQKDSPSVLAVNVAAPELLDWSVAIPASGWFAPWQEAVIAAEIDGVKICEVLAEVGDVVQKGQVLARLAPEAVQAECRRLEAIVAGAKADYEKAKANGERSRSLKQTGAETVQALEEFQYTEASAAAALAAAQAALDFQQIKLAQTQIVAIDDGAIASRSAKLGAVVSTGTELFRIIRQQRVEWQAEVTSRQLSAVKVGQEVSVITKNGEKITGHVRALDPAVNKETARAIVYVDIGPPALPLAGVYAGGSILLGSERALTIPESALVLRDGFTYVFSLGVGSRVTRVRVEPGRRQDGRVEIVQGLDSHARVVQSGGAFLSDGAVVTVVGAATAKESGK